MTAAEHEGVDRAELEIRLAAINRAERRHGVPPRFTVGDAVGAALSVEALRIMVAAEADHLVAMARSLKGVRL